MVTQKFLGARSFIRRFQYDWETHCLSLTFKNQKTYRYEVNEALFQRFLNSPNKGQFYNQHIKKSSYPTIRLSS